MFRKDAMFAKIKNMDFVLLIIPILLTVVGIALIYSLVFSGSGAELAIRQSIFFIVALAVMFLISTLDYRVFSGSSWYLYVGAIILLIIVDVFGKTSGGATRWIDFKIFQIQPSEFYKFVSIIFLSSFFAKKISRVKALDIIYMFLMLLPPLFLVLIQPDLGTALVIVFSWFVVVIFSKLNLRQYITIFLSIILFLAIFTMSFYKIGPFTPLMKDYQRSRVETFINPSSDPFGQGYNVQQALIATGSGGMFGRGLGHGSQSQLQFLPKPETDFIFSGYSEAFGLIGDLFLLLAFLILVIRMIDIANLSKDSFGYLLSVGIASTFFFQIIVNIGMNIGLAPVTGIPLPFLSSGGSSLLTSFFMIGILQSIFIHRKKMLFK